MRILGIIPARYASTRFPGKPLADINGKTMIECVYERAKMSESLCDVLVATDDTRIYDCVKSFGGQAVMTSSELPNGTARCEQAVKIFTGYNDTASELPNKTERAEKNFAGIDAVINIQGDEPLLDPLMIDEVAELLRDNYCVTLCSELVDDFANPNVVKVVLSRENFALYFSRSLIPYKRNKSDLPIYQHIGIYGYSVDFLRKYVSLPATPLSDAESLEQLKILEHDYKIRVKITDCKNESVGVDTPEDLERVRGIMRCRNSNT